MLTDFVAFPEGEEEGSQGLERSVNPWDVQKKTRILKGCESSKKRPNGDLASLQDALISLTVPGIYASLQSLATFSNPFGIMAGNLKFQILNFKFSNLRFLQGGLPALIEVFDAVIEHLILFAQFEEPILIACDLFRR